MRAPASLLTSLPPSANHAGRSSPRLTRGLGVLITGCLLITDARAMDTATPAAKDEFPPLVRLAPFVVNGQSLAISIYARTSSDRRYGKEFAERVVKVVYEAVTESTGRGLVIIGAKDEPPSHLRVPKISGAGEGW